MFLFLSFNLLGQKQINYLVTKAVQKINSKHGNLGDVLGVHELFGNKIADIGDLDGDGVPDLAVSAFGEDNQTGALYILFMNKDGTVKSKQEINQTSGNLDTTFPTAGYQFGVSVTSLGDLDGDGIQDLAVGASGANVYAGNVWILFMNRNGTVKSKTVISDFNNFQDDLFGYAVSGMGDLDGDGIPDLAIGSYGNHGRTGLAYIAFLNKDGTVKNYSTIKSGSPNFTNLDSGVYFAVSLRNIGDRNGDGINDIAIGSQADNDGNTSAGAVYIINLTKAGGVKSYTKISNLQKSLSGIFSANEIFGSDVSNLPDVNGDGIPDLLVGAEGDNGTGTSRGAFFVLCLDSSENVKSYQEFNSSVAPYDSLLQDNDNFGNACENMVNFNSSYFLSFAINAYTDSEDSANAGAVYIINLDPITNHNISLSSIALSTDTLCGSLSLVSVWIKNLSGTTLTTVPLTIILSGDTQIILHETVTNVSIASGDSLIYKLKSSIPAFSDKTINEITIIANVPGNANAKDDTVQAKIYYIPVSANFSAPEVCLGATTQFNNLSKGGISAYSWNFGDGATSTITSPAHLYAHGGTYNATLKITATGGCTGIITIPVKVDSIPQLAFIIKSGCAGDSVHFINTTNTAKFTLLTLGLPYRWNFGDGSTSDSTSPYHIYTKPGNYPVTLKITDNFGCKDSVTATDDIIASPLASFVALNDSTLQATEAYSYQWFKNGQLLSGDTLSKLIITSGGNYAVEVTNAQGCSSLSSAITLKGQPPTLFLPNAFTPNGDGIDDTFKAVGRGITYFQMLIYNRWGELVFQTTNINKGWDGFFQSRQSPTDFYLYLIKYNGYETKEMIQKGTFWLLR